MVSVLRVVSKSDSFCGDWVVEALRVWVKRRCVAIGNGVAYCNINFGTGQDDFTNPVRLGNRTYRVRGGRHAAQGWVTQPLRVYK